MAPMDPAKPMSFPSSTVAATEFDPKKLIAAAQRRWRPAIAVATVVTLAVLGFASLQTPKYSADTRILVASHDEEQVAADDKSASVPPPTIDSPAVDTRVQILQSRALAAEVADTLNLKADPEFNPAAGPVKPPGPLSQLKRILSPARPAPAGSMEDHVITALMNHVKVVRAGLTYIVDVTASSKSADRAAQIANAYADQFILDQLRARTDQAAKTTSDISPRLAELTHEVQAADAAVQEYKIQHGLLSANGATLAEQEVSNYDQQLALAKADFAEKRARMETARAQLEHGGQGEDVGAALSSDTIRALRSQEAEASRHVADLTSHYGDDYPDVVKARQDLVDTKRQIHSEIERILSNLSAETQVASQRLASLQATQNGATGTLASNNSAQVGLLELQRRADASHSIYEAYLNASKESASQQGTLQPDARVVSRAQAPTSVSSPDMRLALLLGIVAGLLASLATLVLLELMDDGIESTAELERLLATPSAGMIPLLASVRTGASRNVAAHKYIAANPYSAFSEAFRSLRAFLLLPGAGAPAPKVLAITSALPGEGKSLTSFCLAQTYAIGGDRTVLIDCDLRRRGLSNLAGGEGAGLVDVLDQKATLAQALVRDEFSGAFILRASDTGAAPTDLFTGERLATFISALKDDFDVILLDTSPVLAIAETRLVAAKADAVLMLSRWRRTPVEASREALSLLYEAGANVVGVALTQADLRKMALVGHSGRYTYNKVKSYYAG